MAPRVHSDSAASSYLTYPILAFHHLFASGAGPSAASAREREQEREREQASSSSPPVPFTGLGADWEAHEAKKEHTSILTAIHASLASPRLAQTFKDSASIAMELAPLVSRMLAPQISPVMVGGSANAVASVRRDGEKKLVARAVNAMEAVGAHLEKVRVEAAQGIATAAAGWAYRLDPPLDAVGLYPTLARGAGCGGEPVRYAVRQVLDQEWHKSRALRDKAAREARMGALSSVARPFPSPAPPAEQQQQQQLVQTTTKPKRDFFGRPVAVAPVEDEAGEGKAGTGEGPRKKRKVVAAMRDVWVTYNEGFSNAVRKGIRLDEFMEGLI